MSEETPRDEELGAALRALPVPEHRPGFWQLALPAEPSKAPGGRRVWLAVAAVVLAIAGVSGVALAVRGGADGTGVVAGPAGSTAMLTGTLEGELRDGDRLQTFSQRFAFAVDGSASLVLADGTGSQVFDARARKSVISSEEGSGRGMGWFIREHVEPQPVQLSNILGGLAVTMSSDDGAATTMLGRPVHRFIQTGALRVFGNRGEADRVEVVTDDETGVMLRYEATLGGVVVAKMEVLELTASRTVDRSLFEVHVPPGETIVSSSDDGVRLVALDELQDAVGYAVDAPRTIGRYRLDSVAARPGMPGSQSSARDPLDRDRVQLLYRDGWRAFEVLIRRTPPSPTTTTLAGVLPESTAPYGAFTVTVRGTLDAAGRADALDRIRPRDAAAGN